MPLLWLSLAFVLGILAAGLAGWGNWPAWAGAAGACLGLGLLLRRFAPAVSDARRAALRDPRLKFPPYLLLVLFALGGLRWALAHQPPGPGDLAWYNGKGEFALSGWVSADPSRRDTTLLLRVEVTGLEQGGAWQAVRGPAQVQLPAGNGEWAYGDRVLLRGKPVDPPQGQSFSYRDFLAAQGVYTYLGYPHVAALEGRAGSAALVALYRLRAAGAKVLETLYPPPEAQLMQGILLGVDERIPEDVTRDFQATGIAHVIAISGFNMSLLSGLFLSVLRRFLNRWWAALWAALALGIYALLAGGGASVARAAIMCALALAASQLGRTSGGLNALTLAGAVMCLFEPNLPWDVGFQLSFAATLGLLFFAGPLQSWFGRLAAARLPDAWAGRVTALTGEYLLCTLAAQAAVLPVQVAHFQSVSLVSLLANPLVLPAQPPLMVLGGLSLLAGLVWLPLGRALAAAGWLFAAWTVGAARVLGSIPGGEISLGPAGTALLLGFSTVLLAALALREKLRELRVGALLALIPLAGLAAFAARTALSAGDGRLHVIVFDTPGGPAVLLREPGGAAYLAGGSDDGPGLEAALGRWLPPAARLEGVFVPPEAGQKGLPAAVKRFRPARVDLCPDAKGLKTGMEAAARETGAAVELLGEGRALDWGAARLEVGAGCTLTLRYGDLLVVLPGAGAAADLSTELHSQAFVLAGPAVGETAESGNARLLQAPAGGWLHLQSDGRRVWIETSEQHGLEGE
jgi:competence protein ComEC